MRPAARRHRSPAWRLRRPSAVDSLRSRRRRRATKDNKTNKDGMEEDDGQGSCRTGHPLGRALRPRDKDEMTGVCMASIDTDRRAERRSRP